MSQSRDEHRAATSMRRLYDALALALGPDRDRSQLTEVLADDTSWHVGGLDHLYRGREAVFGFLDAVMAGTHGTFRFEVHDVLGDGEHGAALATVHGNRGDKVLAARLLHLVRFTDGRVAELWAGYEDPQVVASFWQ